MIKKDIVDDLQSRHGAMTRAEVEQHTDTLLDLLGEVVTQAEGLTITHFGTFSRKRRRVREVVLPDGRRVLSGAAERTVFRPGSALKTFINATEEGESHDG